MRRSTPAVRSVPSGGSDQLSPSSGCPATEAINSDSPDGRPAGEGPTSNFHRWTEPRMKGLFTPSIRPALVAKGLSLRIASIPSWAKPVQQGSRTQVSMVGNLGESLTVQPLLADPPGVEKALAALRPKSVDLVHIHFNYCSHAWCANASRMAPPVTFDHSSRVSTRRNVPHEPRPLPHPPRAGERGPVPGDLSCLDQELLTDPITTYAQSRPGVDSATVRRPAPPHHLPYSPRFPLPWPTSGDACPPPSNGFRRFVPERTLSTSRSPITSGRGPFPPISALPTTG